jgi:AcrR family transcriptional regulator
VDHIGEVEVGNGSMTNILGEAPGACGAGCDRAKRRQIMEGAWTVFLSQGFDAASMGEIARQAGVSKGTLYVYFKSKEDLFGAIVGDACIVQAEQVFTLDPNDHDAKAVLTRVGCAFVRFLCRPNNISVFRAIVGIAERMPEIGKRFYEAGPAMGRARLADYLSALTAAGVLRVDDPFIAASQFLDACQSTMFKPMLLNVAEAPDDEKIEHVVGMAVRMLLAAYAPR